MAANLLVLQFEGRLNPAPTPVNFAMAEMLNLSQMDSLERYVLEARLLVQEDPQEIAERSHLSVLTITAYSELVFDVRGRDRKEKWLVGWLRPAQPTPDTAVAGMGGTLKHMACFGTNENLEEHIQSLYRLDGRTMADGLPDQPASEAARELASRIPLAKSLLPNTAAMEKLLQRFDEASMNDVEAGRQSIETFHIGIQILRRAKIPAALRNDIRRVRELRTQAAEPCAD